MREYTCTIAGMRPHKLAPGVDLRALCSALEGRIRDVISQGYSNFLSGMVRAPCEPVGCGR